MPKILAFSKYLTYMVGGAEKSTYEILKQESKGIDIELLSFANINSLGAKNKKMQFIGNWKISYINDIFVFKIFFYWEYVLNKGKVKKYFSQIDKRDTILYTYGVYAPCAVNSFKGKVRLFIRSETDLGINKNYYQGIKKYLKYIYMVLEYFPFCMYKKDLKYAIKKAEVVCNSKYMAQKLKEMYNKESTVLYPFIDEPKLKDEFTSVRNEIQTKGVVFVGDVVIKGSQIAKKIAAKMPKERFYFFSRYITEIKVENNITWMPWQKRELDIYKYASCVIVPSIWEEAYGRVSREAYILGIPTLVSNIGGLPETVDEKKDYIIDDFKNIQEWKKRIEDII